MINIKILSLLINGDFIKKLLYYQHNWVVFFLMQIFKEKLLFLIIVFEK